MEHTFIHTREHHPLRLPRFFSYCEHMYLYLLVCPLLMITFSTSLFKSHLWIDTQTKLTVEYETCHQKAESKGTGCKFFDESIDININVSLSLPLSLSCIIITSQGSGDNNTPHLVLTSLALDVTDLQIHFRTRLMYFAPRRCHLVLLFRLPKFTIANRSFKTLFLFSLQPTY